VRILAFILAGLIWLLISLVIKAVVDFRYIRNEKEDHLDISMKALHGLWKFNITLPAFQLNWDEGPELEIEQKTESGTGSVINGKHRLRFLFWRKEFFQLLWPQIPGILQKLEKIKYNFYRGIHCTFINWHLEIGFPDPVKTALVTGSLWAIIGYFLARLHRQITMDTDHPHIQIIPQFQKPGFACEIHCIFNLRMGHIIIAGLKLLRIFQHSRRG
jgi:hypothetical protein